MDAERLHVLLADPHLQGGGQVRYVSSLARELTRFGHTVTIACRPGSVLEEAARTAGCAALPVFQFRGGVRPASWANDLRQAVRFIRKWRAHRKATGKRIRPLRKELCAMWGISKTCFEDAARGRTYWWVR